VSISIGSRRVSSSRSSSLGCTVNSVSLKSRKSRIVSLPRPRESAMYALKAVKDPDGGFARSTITHSMVCPWDLKSVNAYAAVSGSCNLFTVIFFFPPMRNDFRKGKIGIMPFGRPGKVIFGRS